MSSDGGARTAGSKRKAREDPSETAPEKKYRAGTDESVSAAAPPEESLSSADKGAAETRADPSGAESSGSGEAKEAEEGGAAAPPSPRGSRDEAGRRSSSLIQVGDQAKLKLYVTKLPTSLDQSGLRRIFDSYGLITRVRILTQFGKSRGVGFVHYATAEGAARALEALHDTVPDGYDFTFPMAVSYAKQKREARAPELVMPKNLYVAHMPISYEKKDLRKLFERFGEIEEVKILRDPRTKESRRVGFVHFKCSADARRAIAEMDDHKIPGESDTLLVKFARNSQATRQFNQQQQQQQRKGDSRRSPGGWTTFTPRGYAQPSAEPRMVITNPPFPPPVARNGMPFPQQVPMFAHGRPGMPTPFPAGLKPLGPQFPTGRAPAPPIYPGVPPRPVAGQQPYQQPSYPPYPQQHYQQAHQQQMYQQQLYQHRVAYQQQAYQQQRYTQQAGQRGLQPTQPAFPKMQAPYQAAVPGSQASWKPRVGVAVGAPSAASRNQANARFIGPQPRPTSTDATIRMSGAQAPTQPNKWTAQL